VGEVVEVEDGLADGSGRLAGKNCDKKERCGVEEYFFVFNK
jgi:hypothetical protein